MFEISLEAYRGPSAARDFRRQIEAIGHIEVIDEFGQFEHLVHVGSQLRFDLPGVPYENELCWEALAWIGSNRPPIAEWQSMHDPRKPGQAQPDPTLRPNSLRSAQVAILPASPAPPAATGTPLGSQSGERDSYREFRGAVWHFADGSPSG